MVEMSVTLRGSGRDLGIAGVVLVWVPLVLGLDALGPLPVPAMQVLLGAGTWALLVGLLRRERPLVRAAVGVVVGYATLVEYTFSPLLHVYVYRLGTVPAFVPPGHGLVYLAALALGRCAVVRRLGRPLVWLTLAAGTAYAAWGLFLSPRLDVLGALWLGCLAAFLFRGRAPLVYVGAFLVVTYLEILGTSIGTWAWSTHDPTGVIPIGNPPSGVPGGYGFFDAAGMALAPWVVLTAQRLRGLSVGWPAAARLDAEPQRLARSAAATGDSNE